jgi:muramoyltetrapeptide carboxypeptidase
MDNLTLPDAITNLRKDSNSASMRSPSPLKPGDKVAIVATARKISRSETEPAEKIFENWGYTIAKGLHLYDEDRQFAGTDNERWTDLQLALDDPSVKAILFARGGYGTVRIVDKLDFSKYMKNPKWLIGFSDVTALLSHIEHHCKVETIHGPMAVTLPLCSQAVLDRIHDILSARTVTYHADAHILNKRGSVKGELVGGNLSVIYSLSGTPSEIHSRGKILFLEDLDEYLYHIDRMMMNLKRSGKLDGLKGLIVGGMTDMNDNKVPFGMTAEEIIYDAVKEYDYPVCFGFPSGHINDNNPLVIGRKVALQVSEQVTLQF